MNSWVDVREHSRTGVTTTTLLLFLPFFLSRFSHVLVSGSLPLSTDALMTPSNLHHMISNALQEKKTGLCWSIEQWGHWKAVAVEAKIVKRVKYVKSQKLRDSPPAAESEQSAK